MSIKTRSIQKEVFMRGLVKKKRSFSIGLILVVLCCSGCRGWQSENEPIHLNPNMDKQAKIKRKSKNSAQPPLGTIPWGQGSIIFKDMDRGKFLQADVQYYTGKNEDGSWVETIPEPVTPGMIQRGRDRFNIYCAVCHDRAGTGKGTIIRRGFVPPPDYSDERILKFKDGEIFDVITNGIRNMPSYKKQVGAKDRWAIVAYVRALQKSRTATLIDVPEKKRSELKG